MFEIVLSFFDINNYIDTNDRLTPPRAHAQRRVIISSNMWHTCYTKSYNKSLHPSVHLQPALCGCGSCAHHICMYVPIVCIILWPMQQTISACMHVCAYHKRTCRYHMCVHVCVHVHMSGLCMCICGSMAGQLADKHPQVMGSDS